MSYDKIRDPRKLRHWIGDMECDYIYTAGIAGQHFFATIRDEAKLLATRCEKCDTVFMPPRIYCDRCFAELGRFIDVPSTGSIQTFTVTHQDINGEPLPEPITLAFIHIDNTDGGLIHQIGEVAPEKLKIGMRVKAVFRDKPQRKGVLADIKYFKPT